MPNWKDPATNETLLAALVAHFTLSQNAKLDYQALATLIGNGSTYDAVEGRFRKIKKDAAILQAEVDSGERVPPPLPNRAAKKEPSTPRKQPTLCAKTASPNGVISGRVSKSKPNTPNKGSPLKQELLASPAWTSSADTTTMMAMPNMFEDLVDYSGGFADDDHA